VPPLWALTLCFGVMSGLGAISQAALPILLPSAAAYLSPESAAATTGLITALTGGSSLFSPLLGQLADRKADFRLPLLIANAIQLTGYIGSLLSLLVRSVGGYIASATLVAMGGNACLMLSFALAGAYGALAPHRASSITSTLVLSTTLLQSAGLGLLTTFPFTPPTPSSSASAPQTAPLSLVSVYILTALAALSPGGLFCLPRRWLQPQRAGTGTSTGGVGVSTSAGAGASMAACNDVSAGAPPACVAYAVLGRYVCGAAYRPLLLLTAAISAVNGAVYFLINFYLYYLEDHTSVGEAAASWFSAVSGYATLALALLVLPMGACLDCAPRYRTYLACMLLLALITAATPHVHRAEPLGWFCVPAAMTAFQALNLLSLPLLVTAIPEPAAMSRDITMSTSVQAVAMALNAFGLGLVLQRAATGELMLGGRHRYALAGYQASFGAAAGEILVGAAGILFCGELVRRSSGMRGEAQALMEPSRQACSRSSTRDQKTENV